MENMKKKRSEVQGDSTRISGKKIRSKTERISNGGPTTDDPELEEFLTILNRLQAGFKYFKEKGTATPAYKAVVAPGVTDAGSWNPMFELDDFNQIKDNELKRSTGDRRQDNDVVVGFDLNADPDLVPDHQKLG